MDLIQLALFHFEQKDSDEALKIIDKIKVKGKETDKFHAAYLLFDFGFLKEAREILEELIREKKADNAYKSLLADLYIELNEDEKAIKLLHEIDIDDQHYLPSLLQLADLYQSQGLYEVAEQKLLEAKKINPRENIIDLALAELYFYLGKFKECIPIYEQFLKEKASISDIVFTERLAEAYAGIGNHKKAFLYYEQSRTDKPDILFKFGLSAYHLKRYEVAIQKWKELLEIDPYYYVVYQYLGKAYYKEKMFKQAEELVQRGLTFDEHNDDLYFLASKIARNNNHFDQALKFVERAIELNPERRELTLFYINLLRESSLEEKVIKVLTKALEENNYDPVFLWELARSYYELDEFDQALEHYEEIEAYFSKDENYLYEFGHILIEAGRLDKGIKVLTKYLKIVPTDESTLEFLDRLKSD